jgi:hypothetical protein
VSKLTEDREVDRLFGLAPEAFVAARDKLARQHRRDGDQDAAARVKALRRPSLSAWAVNQLARGRRPELERLLDAGERLRGAHRADPAGSAVDELRAAALAEREAVNGLVAAALDLLREAGHRTDDATRDRVASTLHAAAADPAAADLVRGGRLTRDLDAPDFGAAPPAGGPVSATRPPRAKRGGGAKATATGRQDDAAAARARRQAAVSARDEARKRARRAADQAVLATRQAERLGRMADQAEREAARARSAASAAIEGAVAARERAAAAVKKLREAEDRVPTADD